MGCGKFDVVEDALGQISVSAQRDKVKLFATLVVWAHRVHLIGRSGKHPVRCQEGAW